jgi:TolB protein
LSTNSTTLARLLAALLLSLPLAPPTRAAAGDIFPPGTVPEVALEARTLSYYRPALLLPQPLAGSVPLETFENRLRQALALAGTLKLHYQAPDPAILGAQELAGLVTLDERVRPGGGAQTLDCALAPFGGGAAMATWSYTLGAEAARQAQDLAQEILLLLTGYRAPFDSRLLYVQPGQEGSQLVLSDFFGEERQVLSRSGKTRLMPAWSADGRNYAWVQLHPQRGADIWAASVEGGEAELVLGGPGGEAAPAWSPDGRWLACAATVQANTDIYLVPMDPRSGRRAGDPVRLTRSPAIDTNPAWSPDGRHLVFSSDRGGALQLYTITADGLDEQRISFLGTASDCPAWSPDGEWIAFVSRERNGWQIFQMRPDGSDWVRLTDEQGNHFDPRWSPDGQHLAYTWQREVWVMLADGTGRRQVSRGGGEHPSWEPVALTQK